MYKYKLKSFILLCLVVFVSMMPALDVWAANEGYQIVINDEADLLTQEEEANLENEMKPLSEFGHIAFVTVNKNNLGSTKKLAEKYYRTYFKNESGTLMLIDMQERYIYLFSDGDNYSIVSKRRAEVITDNCYRFASKKQYYECAKEAFHEIHELQLGRQIAQPMKYISNGLLAVLLGLIINYIYVRKVTDEQGKQNTEPIFAMVLSYVEKPVVSIRNRKRVVCSYGNYDSSDSYSSSSSSSAGSSSSSSRSYSGGSSSSSSRSSGSSSGSRSSGRSGGGGGHKF